MARVIYRPRGRAAEYADWAVNLYRGCPHGCAYCYGPGVLRMAKYAFHTEARARKDILTRLERDAVWFEARGESLLVHLCFSCDPYPRPLVHAGAVGVERLLTRHAIEVLKGHGHRVQILTKGGRESTRDLDLLGEGDEYAATLTLENEVESRLWEPNAALPWERLEGLRRADWLTGARTWVSLEPVIFPEQSLRLLEQAISVGIREVKVGPLNYAGRLPTGLRYALRPVNWTDFAERVGGMCAAAGVEVYEKEGLRTLIEVENAHRPAGDAGGG